MEREVNQLRTKAAVSIQPGKIDRSPTGTALSARMALLHHSGLIGIGDSLTVQYIIGSEFQGKISDTTTVGDKFAIIPEITGAWVTGTQQHLLDPDDPWPEGYRLADTWPSFGSTL